MHRRDALKWGAALSLGGSSCASLLNNPGAMTAATMDEFLTVLDGARESISKGSFFEQFLPQKRTPDLDAKAQAGEILAKKTMRSLLLVGTLQELPPEQQAHEGVQQRLRDSMEEFDDAMFGMSDVLRGLNSQERRDVAKALRDDPELGMRVMGAVDEQAAAFGVSFEQRTKLRGISAHVCSRLRQSPELTMTEYVSKMDKFVARHGAQAEQERVLATALTTQMIFQQDGTAAGGSSSSGLSPPPPPPSVTDEQPPPPPAVPRPIDREPKPERERRRASPVVLTVGGAVLGAGAILIVIGAAANNPTTLLLGLTFGALLAVAGLITLIVGLILLAAGK